MSEGNLGEREFEVGKDEAWFANIKRTYDEYQQASLESTRTTQFNTNKLISDAQANDNVIRNIATQALQNAVETANMVGKQTIRHADLATDRQWNVDEVAHLVAKTPAFMDAIVAEVIKATK